MANPTTRKSSIRAKLSNSSLSNLFKKIKIKDSVRKRKSKTMRVRMRVRTRMKIRTHSSLPASVAG